MKYTKLTKAGNTYKWNTIFMGKRMPVSIELPKKKNYTLKYIVQNINRRIERKSPQERLMQEIGKPKLSSINEINITYKLPNDTRKFSKGSIMLSFDHAMNLRGNKLAWVLGSGTDKGLCFPGIFKGLEIIGKPDYIFGSSTGGYFGSFYCRWGSAEAVKTKIYKTLKSNDKFKFLDIDILGLTNPANFNGFMPGKKLMKLVEKNMGLKGKKFSDFALPFFVFNVELKNGHGYLFGDPIKLKDEGLIENPKYKAGGRDKQFVQRFHDKDMKVINVLRGSGSIPGIFKPFKVGSRYFIDGGVKQSIAVKAAGSFIDIGRIVAIHLGHSDLYSNVKNIINVIMQTMDIQTVGQLDALSSPKMKNLSVRVVNPGLFSVKMLQGISKFQDLIISGRNTMQKLISKFKKEGKFDANAFFNPWTQEVIDNLNRSKLNVKVKRENVYYIEEKKPFINEPEKIKRIARMKDGGPVHMKRSDITTNKWIFGQMKEQLGKIISYYSVLNAIVQKFTYKLLFKLFGR